MSSLTVSDGRLSRATVLPDDFIDYYMPRANGEFVKIYLYLLRIAHTRDSNPTLTSMAEFFSCMEKDILSALRYWERAGLLALSYKGKELSSVRLLPLSLDSARQETPEDPLVSVPDQKIPKEQIRASAQISASRVRELKETDEVREILYIAQQYIGRPLSPTDMRRILYFYDELHFPPDLIDYLVEYCVSKGARNLNYIEKVALAWHEQGLTTLKAAKTNTNIWKKKYFTIYRAFGIRNRIPIPEETVTMDRWLSDFGFTMDIIQEAAARTLAQTGVGSFRYADRILSDWHAAGVHHLEDIAPLDEKHKAQAREKQAAAKPASRSARNNTFNTNFDNRKYNYEELEQTLQDQSRE